MSGIDSPACPPIFFIGAPRSGTTIFFEVFGAHESIGWLSNYSDTFPDWPSLNVLCRLFDNRFFYLRGKKKQHGRLLPGNRFLPRPEEAYNFWNRYCDADFSRDYLLGSEASPETASRLRRLVRKTSAYQGKPCMANKITGPGRIGYLRSIFPDARFVHVIRNGRDVVRSLMKVGFWKDGGGYERPWWNNGLSGELLDTWEQSGRSPEVLAAIQWVAIVQSIRKERATLQEDEYFEVKYEDFVTAPHSELRKLYSRLHLEDSNRAHRYIDETMVRDRANEAERQAGSVQDGVLDEILASELTGLGYRSAPSPRGNPASGSRQI